MAETSQLSTSEKVQAQLRAAADKAAFSAIMRYSSLKGDEALRTARHVVTAATPHIRAEYVQKLAGITAQESLAAAGAALATLGVDLAVLAAAAATGGRKMRVFAGTAIAMHTALVGYSKWRTGRLRAAARRLPDTAPVSAGRAGGQHA